ncbi:MAG: glycosyltransferase [Bryobacteraceae bacterium]
MKRIAIVHYWLLGMRGGEKVVEALCRMLPDADVFTLFYDPEKVSDTIRRRRVTASWLNPLRGLHRSLLPLMPYALESFDLRGYDLVISSESGPAKGVITPSNTRHVCYCHSPMRYLWDLYPEYLHEWTSGPRRWMLALFSHHLRLWDQASALRVDQFVANSRNVRQRIWKTYRREAEVIYPPVAVESFRSAAPKGYYLVVSELVAYKRVEIAVRACSRDGLALKIVGEGPEYRRLRSEAGSSIEFCGRVNDDDLRTLYSECRALLMPGEEDFGIAPVEALASGKPVIAYGRGGVLESVPPEGGVFYDEPDAETLAGAIRRFEEMEPAIQPEALQKSASRFSEAAFRESMSRLLFDAGKLG